MILVQRAAKRFVFLTFWAVFFSSGAIAADSSLYNFQSSLNDLIYSLSRSIVTIEVINVSPRYLTDNADDETIYDLISTGIVYDTTGNILAMASSVVGRSKIFVKFEDKVQSAVIRAVDYQSGLAILHINEPFGKPIELIKQHSCVGQMVLALGNAYGLRISPSLGFCAGIRPDGYVQFTAPVTSGTHGGGLFNLYGQLVGIITGGIRQDNQAGLGLAISAQQIPGIVQNLLAKGDRLAGYLGLTTAEIEITPPIEIRQVNYLAKAGTRPIIIEKGVVITNVIQNSPAAKINLKKGDLLFSIDNQMINSAAEIADYVKKSPPGTLLELGILRQTNAFYVQIETGEKGLNYYQSQFTTTPNNINSTSYKDSLFKELQSLKQTIFHLEKRLKHLK
ncbi:MAG: S1C family serine protease [Candidatus Zixiibacteriota bacterium]